MLYTESWADMAAVSVPNMIAYAKKHGYNYSPNVIPEPYEAFDKINTCYDSFSLYDIDVILNKDLDTVITNFDIRVEDFLEDGKDFYICEDCNGINAGVFLIRKSLWSKQFLWYLMNKKGKEGMECEQNAIQAYMDEFPNDSKIKILEQGFNDYPLNYYEPSYGKWGYKEGDIVEKPKNEWREDSFIIHTPGLPLEQRLSILKNTPVKV